MKSKSILIFVLALAAAASLWSADQATVDRLIKQAPDAKAYPEAGAVILLSETVTTLHADGTTVKEGHRLIKILQDRARSGMSDQKVEFNGGSQQCTVLKAVTHLPSGETRQPEKDGIMEVSDPEAANAPFYSSARLKVISFPAVELGAVLELHYRIEPIPGKKVEKDRDFFSGETYFGGEEPVLLKTLELIVPSTTKLAYHLFNSPMEPVVRAEGGMTHYSWKVADQPQIIPEFSTVPIGELVPRLVWTDARDFKQLGKWLSKKFDARAKPDSTIQARAAELTASEKDAEGRTDAIALFIIRDIQNVPLKLGKVGYDPTPAPVILQNRYADIRDKFTLFKALLNAVKMDALPLFVHASHTQTFPIPCLDQYDEILADVELPGGKTKIYTLTENRLRFGILAPEEAGKPGLLIKPGEAVAVTTPAADENVNRLHTGWTLSLDAEGNLKGTVTTTFDGLFDRNLRERFYEQTEDAKKVSMQQLVNSIKKGAILQSYEISDVLDLRKDSKVTLTFTAPSYAFLQGDMMILNLPGRLTVLGDAPFSPTLPKVKYPCQVDDTFRAGAELSITLPPGYRVAYLPPEHTIAGSGFTHVLQSSAKDDILHLDVESTWREGVLSVAEYPAVWEKFGTVKVPGNKMILLEKIK